jgi:RHS repeat-associated protein
VLAPTTLTAAWSLPARIAPPGMVWRSYYYAGAQRVAMRVQGDSEPANNGVFYLLTDHLGSTSVVVDSDGEYVTGQLYKPWGEKRHPEGASTLPTTWRFTGQRQDSQLGGPDGLYYYNARWYDPYITQFTQPDTIILDQYNSLDWNRYAYARYNPIKYRDPSGHRPNCEGDGNCMENWRFEFARAKLGEIGFLKYEIRYEFGIYMVNGGPKWSAQNLNTAYRALTMVNAKLQGHLKEMVSGSQFTIVGGGNKYYGQTKPTGVDYHVEGNNTVIPLINFLHETGHLLDWVPATANAFSSQLPAKPTWVVNGYVDDRLLLGKYAEAVQSKYITGENDDEDEYWADAFANYVGDNINTNMPAGYDMSHFVSSVLAPYID